MMYNLNIKKEKETKIKPLMALKKFFLILADEKRRLVIALSTMLIYSIVVLFAPLIIGKTIDKYVDSGQYNKVLLIGGLLFLMYMVSMLTSYLQTKLMGGIGQRILYKVRNNIFLKLQELPVVFFHENKAGDLISRINNDTEKLDQFFSQSLMQFLGGLFIMTGSAVFLLSINFRLGLASLIPAVVLLTFSRLISPWVRSLNKDNLKTTGSLSAEIQESISNFKVVVAFNRRDYFRERFANANARNFKSFLKSGMVNSLFIPVYGFFSNIGQLIVLSFGIYLISKGQFTIGFLISFLSYINSFYNPLRQLAALWTNFQTAITSWERISEILNLKSNLELIEKSEQNYNCAEVSFTKVSFHYSSDKEILSKINFDLNPGKTYAFVGPTGGGKTTTASLISRLYDPSKGRIYLKGKDLRSYTEEERSKIIGFILQEPFLFSGTVKDNIVYGNKELENISNEKLQEIIEENDLGELISRFESGLETPVSAEGDTISLGQKQLVAFMRAVLRKPEILILDEATANIDTVTEQQLESVLKKLPASTMLIIIAHRLNTIENADEIFFINGGNIIQAGSMDNALQLLMQDKQES